ncbi:hypothetical protein [Paenibacillus chitinolyticus]
MNMSPEKTSCSGPGSSGKAEEETVGGLPMQYDWSSISRTVGFYRRHQVIPSIEEIEDTWQRARDGSREAAIRFLDWRRHCLLAKTDEQRAAMILVMNYSYKLFNRGSTSE